LLESVPDPRFARGIRHRLPAILAVAIAAVAAGARSFTAIGQWVADADAHTLAPLGFTGLRVPSESAIRRAFARLDATVLDSVLDFSELHRSSPADVRELRVRMIKPRLVGSSIFRVIVS